MLGGLQRSWTRSKCRVHIPVSRSARCATRGDVTRGPEIGSLWRSELVLAEAVTTAGLEGIRIAEGDLLPRIALNGQQDVDPSDAELALGWNQVSIQMMSRMSGCSETPSFSRSKSNASRSRATGCGVEGRRPSVLLPMGNVDGTTDRRSRDQQVIERAFSVIDAAIAQEGALPTITWHQK